MGWRKFDLGRVVYGITILMGYQVIKGAKGALGDVADEQMCSYKS